MLIHAPKFLETKNPDSALLLGERGPPVIDPCCDQPHSSCTPNDISIDSRNFLQLPRWLQWNAPNPPPKTTPFPLTITTPSNTRVPRPTSYTTPNGTRIHSAICHNSLSRQTDRPRDGLGEKPVRIVLTPGSDALVTVTQL